MSDFLGNLIARSLAPAVAIRPRPVSRFEPAAGVEALSADLAPEAQLAEETVPLAKRQARLPPASVTGPVLEHTGVDRLSADARARPVPPAIDQSSAGVEQALRDPTSAPLAAPTSAVAPTPAPAVLPAGSPIAPLAASQDVSTRARQIHVERLIVPERDAIKAPLVVHPAPTPPDHLLVRPVVPPAATSPLGPLVLEQHMPPAAPCEPEAQPQPVSHSEPGLMIRPAATAQPAATLVPIAPASRASDAPGSTIQVTIGRIEVRAAPPARAPQSARSAPAVMSLDEYLRQRGQGGNR